MTAGGSLPTSTLTADGPMPPNRSRQCRITAAGWSATRSTPGRPATSPSSRPGSCPRTAAARGAPSGRCAWTQARAARASTAASRALSGTGPQMSSSSAHGSRRPRAHLARLADGSGQSSCSSKMRPPVSGCCSGGPTPPSSLRAQGCMPATCRPTPRSSAGSGKPCDASRAGTGGRLSGSSAASGASSGKGPAPARPWRTGSSTRLSVSDGRRDPRAALPRGRIVPVRVPTAPLRASPPGGTHARAAPASTTGRGALALCGPEPSHASEPFLAFEATRGRPILLVAPLGRIHQPGPPPPLSSK
mmetsp:Transcript_20678/g.49249  ORF Transcript_20678/g.49249 Transcript_20678/m.49249 type:complete len:304 (+) Transcript_20678:1094-2005(+)